MRVFMSSDSYIQEIIADRLGGRNFGKTNTVYKFARIKALKAKAAKKFPDLPLIDMGVGEPDQPADESVAEVLRAECGKPENRFYADNGIIEFQEAAAGYMERVYGVKGLCAGKNIIHGIGTKPILAMLPLCFINSGDVSLVTVPGYPVLGTYTKYCGGEVYNLPLKKENGFFPDFDSIPADILRRSKLLYINYPNNPTGQAATREFFERVVEFARANNIVVVHDAAYAALTFGDVKPLSFLSVPGAIEVGVEVQSLSKAFNMTGWRLGFIAGNEKVVSLYGTVKDNTDSGQFRAIQKAGIYALEHPEITERIRVKYERRMNLLARTLREIGFDAEPSKGTFYCYVEMPKGLDNGRVFTSAQEVAEHLIMNANISVVPWDDCGGYLRFSVTYLAADEREEIEMMNELKRRMAALGLVF
jgi:LL-diaminopimelate aminotransferase